MIEKSNRIKIGFWWYKHLQSHPFKAIRYKRFFYFDPVLLGINNYFSPVT